MNGRTLKALAALKLRSAVGVYAGAGGLSIVEAARTPLGVGGIQARRVEFERPDADKGAITREVLGELLERYSGKSVALGVRASAVDFVAEAEKQDEVWDEGGARKRPLRVAKLDAGVLLDSTTVSIAKTKFVLTGRVKLQEVESSLLPDDEVGGSRQPRYEPGPFAAWRASLHYAPLRPRGGVHLRYILGRDGGLAILGDRRWPLAWQVLSWKEQGKGSALIQAYHMLALYARRRLSVHDIVQLTAQGDVDLTEGWDPIETTLGREIESVAGPAYDDAFVALGLALGGLEAEDSSLDLARSLKRDKTIREMIPWREIAGLALMFGAMFLVMWGHARGLRGELRTALAGNSSAGWAAKVSTSELKAEQARLSREVQPLSRFVSRGLAFTPAVRAVAELLPPAAWVESLQGSDLVWSSATNRALGDTYLLIRYGAPLVPRGTVPVEIERLVKALQESPYFAKALPNVKLTDINWKQQGVGGVTHFTVVAKRE